MKEMIMRLVREEDGQAMTEYGLIIALIAVVVIGTVMAIGGKLNEVFQEVETQLNTALGNGNEGGEITE